MLRSILYMAVLGALINTAKCDFECFANKMKVLSQKMNLFFGESKEESCQSGQKKFIDSLQQAIDECSVPVTTDSMKTLIQELCEPGSELYQTFEQSGNCLLFNFRNNAVCQPTQMDSSLPQKEGCKKLKRDFLSCSAKTIGEPCGEKAVKALERILKTSDALTDGMCDELFPSSSHQSRPNQKPVLVKESTSLWSDSLASVARNLHWVAIAVAVLTVIIVIMKKLNKKNASDRNRLLCEKV